MKKHILLSVFTFFLAAAATTANATTCKVTGLYKDLNADTMRYKIEIQATSFGNCVDAAATEYSKMKKQDRMLTNVFRFKNKRYKLRGTISLRQTENVCRIAFERTDNCVPVNPGPPSHSLPFPVLECKEEVVFVNVDSTEECFQKAIEHKTFTSLKYSNGEFVVSFKRI